MDLDNTISAKEIVNQYSEDKLVELFVKNADVKFPKKLRKLSLTIAQLILHLN